MDQREGSRQYAAKLGPDAQLCLLDYGDVALTGNGPHGDVLIGIELKKLNDVINCIGDGRFVSHQLPGLITNYDKVYFIVEGFIRASTDGLLQIGYPYQRKDENGEKIKPGLWEGKNFGGYYADACAGRQRFTYTQLANWLESISNLSGIRVMRSSCEAETVLIIKSLQSWWSKPYEEHGSLKVFHEDRPDAALLVKPSLRRRIANQLPGIGWERSGAVAGHFPSTRDMVNASVDQWIDIPGIGIGIASKVVDLMSNE